jgi:cilia- and flagella-associated protein 57
MGIFDKHKE